MKTILLTPAFVTLNIFVFLERHNKKRVRTLLLNTSLCHLKCYTSIFQLYLGSHQAKMNNTSTPASTMFQFNPLMPISLVVLYWCLATAILVLCILSTVAVYRTKKTPYATKLSSLGLLTYNNLFLLTSLVTKLFAYEDVYPLWHISRGCQLASQIIICFMSIERLFVLSWPYMYLRVMTERRTKQICTGVIVFGFLQAALYRGTACYARNKALNCGLVLAIYMISISIILPAVSFICFIKIFKIIRRSEGKHRPMHNIRQYKGTVASFMVLVNATFNQIIWIGLSVFYFTRTTNGTKDDGLVGTLTDWSNLVNCTVDPLIYVMWFNETRLQLFKMFEGICPFVGPEIDRLKVEIYQLDFINEARRGSVKVPRTSDREIGVSNPSGGELYP